MLPWGQRRLVVIPLMSLAFIWYFTFWTPKYLTLSSTCLVDSLHCQTDTIANLTHLLESNPPVSDRFLYARRTIKTKFFAGDRPEMTVVNGSLFPPLQLLDKNNISSIHIDNLPPLTLPIPKQVKVDTSIIQFGIATTVTRLGDAFAQLSHWLPLASALHVIVPLSPEANITEQRFANASMNVTLVERDTPFHISYFSLIKVLYEARSPTTQWIALLDDDTFIPSLPALVDRLNTCYNSSQDTLVAANTEDMGQIRSWGLIPFGGGGIFISVPLAARLTQPRIWDRCIGGMGRDQGDGVLNACLNSFTPTRTIYDPELNQMDIRDGGHPDQFPEPAAGYFESGRRMLTVHHWKSWFHVDVPAAGRVAQACGFECVFQRFMFPEQNMVLSNGYSIAEYPRGVQGMDFEGVELTWEGNQDRFEHRIGPLRKIMPADEKVGWRMVKAERVQSGVRQLYWRRGDKKPDGEIIDGILELLWLA